MEWTGHMRNNLRSGKLKAESLKRTEHLRWNSASVLLLGIVFLFYSCGDEKKKPAEKAPTVSRIQAPAFNEDSAYNYVGKQVSFGPRVPNSAAHVKCGDYLVALLKLQGMEVREQEFEARAFDGKFLRLRNIIASINPQAAKRILLASHWDSRPFAEKDSLNKNTPIDGANDGASGVGILAELSRIIQASGNKPKVGIDIIFFDGEDYGHSAGMPGNGSGDTWCLGSQYWSKNKHVSGYSAFYGILLDMAGAKGAHFAMEGTSMEYAPEIVSKVWETASASGFGSYFIFYKSGGITDDHSYVNEIAKIPMIDIIDFNLEKNGYFGWYHHTHKDNMEVIDKKTLKAVGQTLLEVIYNE